MAKKKTTDDFSQPLTDSALVKKFKKRCDAAMARIKDIQSFRDSDKMVDFVFVIGKQLFETPLDQQGTGKLVRNGGRLAGAYVYLGQQSSYARAKRDVYAGKAKEFEKEHLLHLISSGTKVTQARAKVTGEMSDLNQLVIEEDITKNQWENITEAVETMVSFIQSAIKVKEGERFHGKNVQP